MSRINKELKQKNKYKPDKVILFFTIAMSIFGAIMIFDASVYQANTTFNDPTHFLKYQIVWLLIGGIIATIIYFWDYRKFSKLSLPFYIGIIGLLLVVLILGEDINGSKRWFTLGPLGSIQPSEFAKIAVILYFSTWLSQSKYFTKDIKKEEYKKQFIKSFISFFVILAPIAILILIEPDLGTTAMISMIALLMFLTAREDKKHIKYTIGLIIAIFIPLIAVAGIAEPYRFKRISTYLSLFFTGEVDDPKGTGYQMQQILIGIGSGGLLGTGFGQSRQRFGYLVENTAFTDSIFAVILEELGFIGGALLLTAWIIFLWRSLKIAKNAPDRQGKLLATGITIWLTLQALINMAANVGIIPLTGIPLPLLTYGGSGTIVALAGLGILLNISKYTKETND